MTPLRPLLIWMLVVAAATAATAQDDATSSGVPEAPASAGAAVAALSVDDMEGKLRELALEGKMTAELDELFFSYADARAREKLVPSVVSEEFWKWLSSNKPMHRAMLVMLHPDYDTGPITALAELRKARPAEVDRLTHLSVAFALVHGGAGSRPVKAGWIRNTRDLSTIPSMLESFGHYADNAGRMVYPLDKVPWPLLVYVADNDVSLTERDWVFSQYGRNPTAAFRKLYLEVPYDYVGLAASASQSKLKITRHPYTLPNIRVAGGVCSDRAYYSSRVMKTFGVPAMYDAGEGLRGGHAWLVWMDATRAGYVMRDSGRFDYDNYYTGNIWNPVSRSQTLDREAELVAAAMNVSYEGYIVALAAGHVYRLCSEEEKAEAAKLLIDAAGRNNYCADLWRLLGSAVAEGILPQKQGEQLFDSMVKPYGPYPDLTFAFLRDVIKPRLTPAEKVEEREIKLNLTMLEKAFGFYERAKRPDLAVKLRLLQGKYLEAVGDDDKALKLYVAASQHYCDKHFGFAPLFDRAIEKMSDKSQQALKLRYLAMMAGAVPEQIGSGRMKRDNPAFTHVVIQYIEALKAAGKEAEARAWQSRISGTMVIVR